MISFFMKEIIKMAKNLENGFLNIDIVKIKNFKRCYYIHNFLEEEEILMKKELKLDIGKN